jgi:hypothetical protein
VVISLGNLVINLFKIWRSRCLLVAIEANVEMLGVAQHRALLPFAANWFGLYPVFWFQANAPHNYSG